VDTPEQIGVENDGLNLWTETNRVQIVTIGIIFHRYWLKIGQYIPGTTKYSTARHHHTASMTVKH